MSPYTEVAERWSLKAVIRALGAGAVVFGVAMLIGGPVRFSAPGFSTARSVPGGVYTWGVALIAAGAVVLAGMLWAWHRHLVFTGLLLEGFWFGFFAISLGKSALATPVGAVTGPCMYGLAAAVCGLLAVGARDITR